MPIQKFIDILPQPDDASCGPTCLHAVYRYFDDELPLDEVIARLRAYTATGTVGGGRESAGVAAASGGPASPEAVEAMRQFLLLLAGEPEIARIPVMTPAPTMAPARQRTSLISSWG